MNTRVAISTVIVSSLQMTSFSFVRQTTTGRIIKFVTHQVTHRVTINRPIVINLMTSRTKRGLK